MNKTALAVYLATMIIAFYAGTRIGFSKHQPAPSHEQLQYELLYPWFAEAGKMEIINTARENGVEAKIVGQMVRRAYYWEEPFKDAAKSP